MKKSTCIAIKRNKKKVVLLTGLFAALFMFSACTTRHPENTTSSTTSELFRTTLTSTVTPTPTSTPTPTPQPLGGGGKLIMMLDVSIIPAEFSSTADSEEVEYKWFSSSPDGSNLTPYDWNIWSLSPDGNRALTYTSDKKVSITNLDDLSSIPLDDSLEYKIYRNEEWDMNTAIWLQNGDVVLLARDPSQNNQLSAYFVTPDGKMNR